MTDMARLVGSVTDMDGTPVHVGVDCDAVTVTGADDAIFTREMAEEFGRLFIAACWQAGENARRMREEAGDG